MHHRDFHKAAALRREHSHKRICQCSINNPKGNLDSIGNMTDSVSRWQGEEYKGRDILLWTVRLWHTPSRIIQLEIAYYDHLLLHSDKTLYIKLEE